MRIAAHDALGFADMHFVEQLERMLARFRFAHADDADEPLGDLALDALRPG